MSFLRHVLEGLDTRLLAAARLSMLVLFCFALFIDVTVCELVPKSFLPSSACFPSPIMWARCRVFKCYAPLHLSMLLQYVSI